MNYISTLFIVAVLFTLFSAFSDENNQTFSTGAPPNHTGAPGENTCAKSGCHSDGVPNSGQANSSFLLGNGVLEYQPGEIYNLTIAIADSNVTRFGYEVTAIVDSDSSFAGDFIITDASRTQIFPGTTGFENRKYLTYTYDGTAAIDTGSTEWTAQWKAPETNVGTVTFYLATISANNDFTDNGDDVYTASYSFSASAVTKIEENETENGLNINVFNRSLNITPQQNDKLEKVILYSVDGRRVFSESINNYQYNKQLNLPEGIYIVHVRSSLNSSTQKIFIH